MRQLFSRPMVLVVCAVAVSLASCSSNNKGKIVGKWKMSAPPGSDEKAALAMEQMKAYPYIEFKADGTFETGVGADDPNVAKMLNELAKAELPRGKYKLLSGNTVELTSEGGKPIFDGKDKGRGEIIINGDEMTLKDPKTSIKCTRVK